MSGRRDPVPASSRTISRSLSWRLPTLRCDALCSASIVIAEDVIAPLDNPLVPMTTTPLGETLGATAGQALMTAFAVVAEYARLLAWPARLSPDYSYNHLPLVTSALDGRFLIGSGHRRGVRRRDRGAVAPQSRRCVRTGVSRAHVLHRQQLRDHDRDHLCRATHVPAKCWRSLSPQPLAANALTRNAPRAAPRLRRAQRFDSHERGADVDAQS